MKQVILMLLLFWHSHLFGQFYESFDKSILHDDWVGDDTLFVINDAGQLQLNATQAGQAAIAVKIRSVADMEWTFKLTNSFSPSTQNYSRYYLMSDQLNLKASLNGWYVQLGGSTGSTDSISLYRQQGLQRKRIIAGRPGTFSKATNAAMIRVLRNRDGNWSLESDTSLSGNYFLEGNSKDTSWLDEGFMGLDCHYTSSNVDGFYLDDVYVGPIIRDSISPKVDRFKLLDARHVMIHFNEPIDTSSALLPQHYYLIEQDAFAKEVSYSLTTNQFIVTFDKPIKERELNHLLITEVKDISGNEMNGQQVSLCLYHPTYGDVVISEIMADPQPTVDLPDAEYIELYNRTNIAIDVYQWQLTDGTSHAIFPHTLIEPGKVVIVCGAQNVQFFKTYGEVVGLDYFPSMNNSGDLISLITDSNQLIHKASYNLGSYHDLEKSNGGWSLEMLNPNALCRGSKNFDASHDASGGSPGEINNTWKTKQQPYQVQLKDIRMIKPQQLMLVFDDAMDSASLMNASIQLSEVAETKRQIVGSYHDTLFVSLNRSIINQKQFGNISGANRCTGDTAGIIDFSWIDLSPEHADRYDVVIHEIMANPTGNDHYAETEYLELYNRSKKVISLAGWTIEDGSTTGSLSGNYLMPGEWMLILPVSKCATISSNKKACITGFPSLGNEGDVLVLRDDSQQVIHALQYDKSWYHDAMREQGGYSLEMKDATKPCMGSENWQACSHLWGGTPGMKNESNTSIQDVHSPRCTNVYPLSRNAIRLTFNEPVLELLPDEMKTNWFIDSARFISPDYTKINIYLHDSLLPINQYQFHVQGYHDCVGNELIANDFTIALPEPLEPGDIIINEILFHPKDNGSDFLEVYNKSKKVLDLSSLRIAKTDQNDSVNEVIEADPEGRLIFPETYNVFTVSPQLIIAQYDVPYPELLITCDLPNFNSNAGHVLLLNRQNLLVDELRYDENMHYALVNQPAGVSLERLQFDRPSDDATNWTSASSTKGFATPTAINSQWMSKVNSSDRISTSPHVFSPDNDGYQDQLLIVYNLPDAGYSGSLVVYNESGVAVKQILNNTLLGTSGEISWNGITQSGNLTEEGIYTLVFNWFNLSGETGKTARSFAVVYPSAR